MNANPQHYAFDALPFETLSPGIERHYITGANEMLACFRLKKGAIIPQHHHDSEQVTYILQGAVRVTIGKSQYVVKAGEVLVIPSNVPHHYEALEDTIDVDVFSPIRQDWLTGTDNYLKQGK